MPSKTKKPDAKLQEVTAERDALALRVMELEERVHGNALGVAQSDQRGEIMENMLMAAEKLPPFIGAQTRTFQAETFAHYARAAKDLGTLGGFPAVEALNRFCIAEMTVLSRELSESRMASVAGVGAQVAP